MTKRQQAALAKLQAQCDRFNADCPIGTEVLVKTDARGNIITRTTSPAQVLSGHTAVVWLDGISGCYLLDRVSKIHLRFERKDGKLIPHAPNSEPSALSTSSADNQPDQPNSKEYALQHPKSAARCAKHADELYERGRAIVDQEKS